MKNQIVTILYKMMNDSLIMLFTGKRPPHGSALWLAYYHLDVHSTSSQGRRNLTRRLDGGLCRKM